MIKSIQQARAIQQKRFDSGKYGIAKAVRRFLKKEFPTERGLAHEHTVPKGLSKRMNHISPRSNAVRTKYTESKQQLPVRWKHQAKITA